jgi:hypothetical protein
MAAQSLSGYDAMLKNVALIQAAQEQFSNSTILLSQLNRVTRTVDGGAQATPTEMGETVNTNRGWVIPVRKTRNLSLQAIADAGTLPAGGSSGLAAAFVRRAFNYGVFEVTAPTMSASKGGGGFAPALAQEMKWLISDFSHDINRQLYGRGLGELGFLQLAAGATGVGVTVGATACWDLNKFIAEGQGLAAFTVADATYIPSIVSTVSFPYGTTASSVTKTTMTLSAAATINPCTFFCKSNATSYSMGKEMMGLLGVCDKYIAAAGFTNTFQGIARSGNSWWDSNTIAGAAAAPTFAKIQQSIDEIATDGGNCNLIITSLGGRAAYASISPTLAGGIPLKYTNEITLKGGWTAISCNGLPMVADPQCLHPMSMGGGTFAAAIGAANSASGVMYFLDTNSLMICQESEPNWADEDGQVLFRMANKDSYEARWRWYSNLACIQPSANCKLLDILVSY